MTELTLLEKMMDEEDGVVNRHTTLNVQPKSHQHNHQQTVTKRLKF
jgi:hypothetical protein